MIETGSARILELPEAQTASVTGSASPWGGVQDLPEPHRQAHPVKVLIIDDNEALTELAHMFLGRLGREVHAAATGAEGLAQLRQVHPDVVICDLNLPDTMGYEVLSSLHAQLESAPPFIFLSGSSDLNAERCRRLGAAAVMAKPCSFAEIDRMIDRLQLASRAKQTAA